MAHRSVLYCVLLQPIGAIECLPNIESLASGVLKTPLSTVNCGQKLPRFQRNTKKYLIIAEFTAINGKDEKAKINCQEPRNRIVCEKMRRSP
jgi:hypothetical protein